MDDKDTDHAQADHKHGSMDIRAQEKTFVGFMRLSIIIAGLSIAVLIFAGLVNG